MGVWRIIHAMRPEFSALGFEDRAKAETALAHLEARLAPNLFAPLAALLGESPDPDGALAWLERYAECAPPELLAALAQHPAALTYLIAIFGSSAFLAETLIAEPAMALHFARDRNFSKLKSKEDLLQDFARFTTINPDHWLAAQLARFQRRHTLRIALKDVLGLATLGETMLELSALADVMLNEALAFSDMELRKRYGHPQCRDGEGRIAPSGFAVISLGQLGGQELDYSSEIDLLFVYARDGETSGGSEPDSIISNKEYFVRLAEAVTRTVTQTAPQGEVFRVHLGLRPEGEEGELAISLASALAYYQHRARDHELQMLIKARHSAGDAHLTRDFLRGVEKSIYGPAGDSGSVERFLAFGSDQSQDPHAGKGDGLDVKLHPGGIRDIENLTQGLQRLHGPSAARVRGGGTLVGMRKLNDNGWLSDRDYAGLSGAYGFLRKVEHRIQLEYGHETQHLPSGREALGRLGRRAGVERGEAGDEGKTLADEVRRVFKRVEAIHQRLLHPDPGPPPASAFDLTPQSVWAEPGPRSFESLLAALDTQAPNLAAVVRQADFPERSRPNVMRLFTAFFSSSERFHWARENPELVRRALHAVAVSDYLAENLADHPEDIAGLNGFSTCGASEKVANDEAAERQLAIPMDSAAWPEPFNWVAEPGVSFRDQMALLRPEFRARAMALAAADAAGMRWIFAALVQWSALAARAVSSAFAIAQTASDAAARARALPIAVLALGRLGENEFDLASPVQLAFVCETGRSEQEVAMANELAARTIEVLSNTTREGSVLAVDTPIRPQGQEGALVARDDAFIEHLLNFADTREIMTCLKALPIAGHEEYARRVTKRFADACFERPSRDSKFTNTIKETAHKLEEESLVPGAGGKPAAIGYDDVDFVVSFLRLRHRVELPPGANISNQIAALRSRHLLTERDGDVLDQGAALLRAVDHAIRIVTGRAEEILPEHAVRLESVNLLLRRWNLIAEGESLPVGLREVEHRVAAVCRGIMDSD